MGIKKHIPNILTLANLFCGIMAIKMGFSESYYMAGFFVIFGAIFDFFDGFAARLLKVQGELGKQLDSLADMVTFGVAPGVIMYTFISDITISAQLTNGFNIDASLSIFDKALPIIAFLIPLLSAIRLAKFNIDTQQSDKFIGMPTPALAMLIISFPLWFFHEADMLNGSLLLNEFQIRLDHDSWGLNRVGHPAYIVYSIGETRMSSFWVSMFDPIRLAGISALGSLMLVVNLEMIALKFKSFGWKENEYRFIFLGLSLVVILLSLLISSVFISIPIIILLYIVLSVINNLLKKSI